MKDIYNEIKSGKSNRQLRELLECEIKAAHARIAEEDAAKAKEAQRKAHLSRARDFLVEALVEYAIYSGVEAPSEEDIQEIRNLVEKTDIDLIMFS